MLDTIGSLLFIKIHVTSKLYLANYSIMSLMIFLYMKQFILPIIFQNDPIPSQEKEPQTMCLKVFVGYLESKFYLKNDERIVYHLNLF